MIVPQPSGFIPPCLPTRVERPPSGPLWVHEIKHDGYRLMVHVPCRTSITRSVSAQRGGQFSDPRLHSPSLARSARYAS